jgi:hypothetical protein
VTVDSERLSVAQYQEALRHVARSREQPFVGDPLASAVKLIEQNPTFAQSRLLIREWSRLSPNGPGHAPPAILSD